ncbi:MAG TPA: hypothetical protein VFW73_02810 [Lacipirellulaceae bacterium]|nr:hypothetical protein [Lacipirellulaceae bacterium]
MRCNSAWSATTAIVVAFGLSASTAWAFPPSNPYLPTATDIQSMIDRTSDYSGGTQATTNVKTDISGGIQLDIDWSTGAPFANETFTRTERSQRFPNDTGDGDGGDLDAYDGVSWTFSSDTPVAVKPFSQSFPSFNFQEGSQADAGCGTGTICVPGGNVPTTVSIDWNMVGGTFGAADRGNVFEIGFQIFGPGLPQDGSTANSTIQITSLATVPEPCTLALLALPILAYIGSSRKR